MAYLLHDQLPTWVSVELRNGKEFVKIATASVQVRRNQNVVGLRRENSTMFPAREHVFRLALAAARNVSTTRSIAAFDTTMTSRKINTSRGASLAAKVLRKAR